MSVELCVMERFSLFFMKLLLRKKKIFVLYKFTCKTNTLRDHNLVQLASYLPSYLLIEIDQFLHCGYADVELILPFPVSSTSLDQLLN